MIKDDAFELIEGLYPKMEFGSWQYCVYCGELPQCRDHVIPFACISNADRNLRSPHQIGPQAPACNNCNSSILGVKDFGSFLERSKYVADRLTRKAIKPAGTWTKNELNPIKGYLKQYIINKQNQKNLFYERSNWFSSDPYYLNLESLLYEPRLQKGNDKFHKDYFKFFESTIERVTSSINLRKNGQRCSEEYYRYGAE